MNKDVSSFNSDIWEKIKQKLKKEVGETAFNNWLKQLKFNSSDKELSLIHI